ncbi:hypothetical protein PINS_up001705 [Pythium insidiosum]|nr:hypothetical protein PINS_up001705 [Pythium insidiosum]
MADATILLVCGLPGAGKTTLLRSLTTAVHDGSMDTLPSSPSPPSLSSFHVETICFDELFAAESRPNAAVFDPSQWKQTQELMVQHVERLVVRHRDDPQADSRRLVLLVDDNFPYRSQRKRFFRLAQQARCGFGVLYVDTAPDVCATRNRQRHGRARVPEDVWQRMADAFEPPDMALHHDTNTVFLSHVSGENEAIQPTQLVAALQSLMARADQLVVEYTRLQEQLAVMEHHRARDREQTHASLLHQVDLALRRWISSVLQQQRERGDATSSTTATLARQLNDARKALLSQLKQSPLKQSVDTNGEADATSETTVDDIVMNFVASSATLRLTTPPRELPATQPGAGATANRLRSPRLRYSPSINTMMATMRTPRRLKIVTAVVSVLGRRRSERRARSALLQGHEGGAAHSDDPRVAADRGADAIPQDHPRKRRHRDLCVEQAVLERVVHGVPDGREARGAAATGLRARQHSPGHERLRVPL